VFCVEEEVRVDTELCGIIGSPAETAFPCRAEDRKDELDGFWEAVATTTTTEPKAN